MRCIGDQACIVWADKPQAPMVAGRESNLPEDGHFNSSFATGHAATNCQDKDSSPKATFRQHIQSLYMTPAFFVRLGDVLFPTDKAIARFLHVNNSPLSALLTNALSLLYIHYSLFAIVMAFPSVSSVLRIGDVRPWSVYALTPTALR